MTGAVAASGKARGNRQLMHYTGSYNQLIGFLRYVGRRETSAQRRHPDGTEIRVYATQVETQWVWSRADMPEYVCAGLGLTYRETININPSVRSLSVVV